VLLLLLLLLHQRRQLIQLLRPLSILACSRLRLPRVAVSAAAEA
jgi:hypothetical protein